MKRKEVRIFLDSNVLFSGLFSDKGPPRLILDVLGLGLPTLIGLTGRYNLIEIERNLEKKLPAALPVFQAYLMKLKMEMVPLPSREDVRRLAGAASPKDVPVLASAINGKADFLVTGDKELLLSAKGKHPFPYKIVSPADFLECILPDILKSLEQK